MPFRRAARKTRSAPRRKRGSAPVSAAVKRYVKSHTPKPEMKSVWQHTNEVAMNTLSQGTVTTMPSILNGLGQARVGSEILARGLHLKGCVNNNSTAESYLRMVVFCYNGAVDPATNFFLASGAGTASAISSVNGLDAMYYPINQRDLKVRYDRVFRLSGSASGNAGKQTTMFSKFIKFGGKKIKFNANTSGVFNQDWQYAICWIAADANDDTSTGTAVEVSMLERFYYTDP